MSDTASFLSGVQTRRRIIFGPKMPSIQELRAAFRGSSKRRKCKAKLSPKQSAKRRWRKVRNKRRDIILKSREYSRRSPLFHMMKLLNRGVKEYAGKFTWWERTPSA